jgi:predicted transposase YbfD/YdcC
VAIDQRRLRRIAGWLKARLPEAQLDSLPDPRQPRGRRWKHVGLLMRVPLLALLAGLKSFAEAEALTAEMSVPLRRRLGIARRVPDTTLRTTAAQMDPSALREGIRRQVRAAHRRKALAPFGLPFGVAAIDGKTTALGAWDATFAQRQVHSSGLGASGLLRTLTAALVSSRVTVCLDASPIPPSTNEMGHFASALRALIEAYRGLELFQVVSTDAGMCSEAHGRLIVEEHHLHYLFALKDDQPTLCAEAQRLLGRRRAPETETVDVVGKHTVTRQLYRTEELAGYLAWTHLRTVVRVHSDKRENATGALVEQENRYFLSSLPSEALTPEQWLLLVRRHWAVENACHNTWDKIFREDDHPWFESGEDAPRGAVVVMLLRRIAYNLLALFRSLTQRSEENRQMPWKDLMRWVYNTLIAATASDLDGLRPRKLLAASDA